MFNYKQTVKPVFELQIRAWVLLKQDLGGKHPPDLYVPSRRWSLHNRQRTYQLL